MGLCVLYYVENSLYNVKKVGFFYLGWNYTLSSNLGREATPVYPKTVWQVIHLVCHTTLNSNVNSFYLDRKHFSFHSA